MQEHREWSRPPKLSQLSAGSLLIALSVVYLFTAGESGLICIPEVVAVWLFFPITFLLPLVGLVLSVLAWNRIAESKGALRGKGLASVGLAANLLIHFGLWTLPTLASCGHPLNKWITPTLALIVAVVVIGLGCSFNLLLNVRHSKEETPRRRYALVGMTLGVLAIFACIGVLLALPYMAETHRRAACSVYLKQLGLVLGLYAIENEGELPPIDDTKNNFIFEGSILYPEYLTDASILLCTRSPDYQQKISQLQSNPECITDDSYIYLGWFIASDAEAEEFFKAYDRLMPEDYGRDILDPEDGFVLFPALKGQFAFSWREQDMKAAKEKLKTMLGSEVALSEIPIMLERPHTDIKRFNHEPPGGYVLYCDGSVDFVEYGEMFPMTETMARLLDARPRAPIPDCD
jgi:hypothetical protein